MNNSQNQNNAPGENNARSKRGLIAGVIVLVVVIGIATFFYNNGSDRNTSAGEKAVEQIAEAKENAEKYAGNRDTSAGNGGSGNSTDTDTDKSENEPVLAPNFTVYTKDGNAVSFSDKIGKPMIINFWATWCGPCKMEMPYFEEAYKQYGDKIEFMMINPTDGANDTHETVDKFLSETGYTFPVYRDTQRSAAAVYGIRSFPTTALVDKDGYFLGGYTGTLSKEMLDSLIELLLS